MNVRLKSNSRLRRVWGSSLSNKSFIEAPMKPVRHVLQQVLTPRKESIHRGRRKGKKVKF